MSNTSQLASDSLYLPVANDPSPEKNIEQRPSTAPPLSVPSCDMDPVAGDISTQRPVTAFTFHKDMSLLSGGHSDTSHSDTGHDLYGKLSSTTSQPVHHGTTKYEEYDSRPMKPLNKNTAATKKATVHVTASPKVSRKPRAAHGKHSNPGTPTSGTPTRHRSPNRESGKKEETFSSSELKKIKEIANSRRMAKSPTSSSSPRQTKKRDRRGVAVERTERKRSSGEEKATQPPQDAGVSSPHQDTARDQPLKNMGVSNR